VKQILTALLLLTATTLSAQISEGYVRYSMQLEGAGEGLGGAMAQSSGLMIHFKKDKALSEMTTPIYNMKMLTDSKGGLMLMDAGGQKSFTRTPPQSASKNKAQVTVVNGKEQKNIAGYPCRKADITLSGAAGKGGKSTQVTVWYTDKIKKPVSLNGILTKEIMDNLNGFPLQVETDQGAMKTKMTAVEVSVKPVADAVFNLSTAGYTERKPGSGFPRPNQ
jgi:hypothetical protein